MADRIAVMNEGLLQQVGTPREVFREPRTRFVAEFVGANNILSGEVEESGPEPYCSTVGRVDFVSRKLARGRFQPAARPRWSLVLIAFA